MSAATDSGGASSSPGLGVVEAQRGDVPLARFGHTTTYMGNFSMIMFGGAVGGKFVAAKSVF